MIHLLALSVTLQFVHAQSQVEPVIVTSIRSEGDRVRIEWAGAIPPYKIQALSPPTYYWVDASYHIYQNHYLILPPSSYTLLRVRTIPDLVAPPAPTGLSVEGLLASEIQLRWDVPSCGGAYWCGDNSGGTGLRSYRIYRDGQLISELAVPVSSTTDAGLQAETSYSYSLTAVDKVGRESMPSEPVAASTLSATPGPTLDSIALEWDPNTEPDLGGYIIYSRLDNTEFAPALTVTNGASGIVTGLQSGLTYRFVATAFDTGGLESDYSNELVHSVP